MQRFSFSSTSHREIARNDLGTKYIATSRTMDHRITPPPTKRRKLSPPISISSPRPGLDIPPRNQDAIRIFVWNINGIAPFLQQSIASFFYRTRSPSTASPESPSSSTSAPPSQHPSEDSFAAINGRTSCSSKN